MENKINRPLPTGTVIEYCGEIATVIRDLGKDLLVDDGDGKPMRWCWSAYGSQCKVVSLPSESSTATST